jgi:hypothetical protein
MPPALFESPWSDFVLFLRPSVRCETADLGPLALMLISAGVSA